MNSIVPENELTQYLAPTWFIDADHPSIVEFARRIAGDETNQRAVAVRLFYTVRDEVRYSAYGIGMERQDFRASNTLALGRGWCVTKACLLAAAARAVGIPCRLGYADVRNHLATKKLLQMMGTDIFHYHGYNEFLLDGQWVKATVAFNESLCRKAKLKPVEWDGQSDSLYHPEDLAGNRHIEYLHDYGYFADLPYEAITTKFAEAYGASQLFRSPERKSAVPEGDFEAELEAEANATS